MDSKSAADTTANIARLKETVFIKTEDNEQLETKPQIHLDKVVRIIPEKLPTTLSTNAQSISSQVAWVRTPVPAPPAPEEILALTGNRKWRPQSAEQKARRNARLKAKREARTPEEVERDKEKLLQRKEKARLKKAEAKVGVIAGHLSTTATTSIQSVSSQVAPVQTPVPAPPAPPLAKMEGPFPIRQPRQRRTPEEIIARNGKRRSQTAEEKVRRNARLKAQRDARTPEEVERDREKIRQRRLRKLALLDPPDPNEPKTIRRRTNPADRPRRKALARRERTVFRLADPEQAKEIRNEKAIKHLNRLAAMTDEELEEYRRKRSFQGLARMANMSTEERADYDLRAKEWRRKWYENLDEEKYKRHYKNIRNWVKRRNQKMKEEDPEKYKALLQKHYENMRAAKKNWTEEDWKRQRIRYRIAQRTKKLKQDKLKEGWNEEEFNRRVEEMKTTLWKELYPDGKPTVKPTGRRRPRREPFQETLPDQFICLKCFPKWNEEKKVWKPAGFKTKIHLLRHVRMRHKSFFFACSYCEILKYSKFSLDVHLKVCLKRKSS